uniref:Uncharacterized protein n=1 Tax=Rhizophora mucronata TaxID=61149 RepID=A0A2P2NV43_RHIMU
MNLLIARGICNLKVIITLHNAYASKCIWWKGSVNVVCTETG